MRQNSSFNNYLNNFGTDTLKALNTKQKKHYEFNYPKEFSNNLLVLFFSLKQ